MRKFFSLVALLLALIVAVMPAFAQQRVTIPELLANDEEGRFTTLLAAVEAADLGETLSGDGPFTLLAPTNDAFAAALEALGLTPEEVLGDTELLTTILTYHVLPDRYFFRQLTSGPTITTVQGEDVTFDLTAGVFTVNGTNVSDIDNTATNGIVQVIDGVLLPPSVLEAMGAMQSTEEAPAADATPEATAEAPVAEATPEATAAPSQAAARPNLPEALANDEEGRFTTLLAAVEAAGLVDTLNGEGPFTLLAPTNEAFDAALAYLGVSASDLLGDTELLTNILTYHVIPGRYFSRNLFGGEELETVQGETVVFAEGAGGALVVNDVTISDIDNVAGNGVFFAIDGVLLPAELAAQAQANRASVRVAHFSPDAGAVDVYLNGAVVATAAEFGTVSEFTEVAAGSFRVGVAATGEEPSGAVIGRVQPGSRTTIVVTGYTTADRQIIQFVEEDYSPIAPNQSRVSFFHAIDGAPTIDIRANGDLLIGGLGYPGTLGDNDGLDSRDVGNATYVFQVTVSGTNTVLLERTVGIEANRNYLIGVIGTPTNPQLSITSIDVTPPATE